MKITKKFLIFFSLLFLITCITPVEFASAKSDITNKKMKQAVGCSDANFKNIQAVITVLKADGYSSAAIAGMLGNAWQESNWNPLSEGMYGLVDTYDNWTGDKLYKECKHLKSSGSYTWCSTGACTTAHALKELKRDFPQYKANLTNYNKMMKAHGSEIKKKKFSSSASKYWTDATCPDKLEVLDKFADFKNSKDAQTAGCVWMCVFERCRGIFVFCDGGTGYGSWDTATHGGTYGDYFFHEFGCDTKKLQGRPAKSAYVYEWITGEKYEAGKNNDADVQDGATDGADKDTQSQIATALVSNGYWNETQLSNFCKLNELNVNEILSNATIDSLNQADLSSLSNWKLSVESRGLKANIIKVLRVLTATVGILITVWMILIYLGFWFDRLNNIIDLDLVGVLTLGKLHTAIEDSDATFSLHNRSGKQVTVSHMNIVMICLSGIVFGVLIISGTFYKMIACLVNFVLRLLQG